MYVAIPLKTDGCFGCSLLTHEQWFCFLFGAGVLDSPTEVEVVRFNDSHITIFWTPPFTVDITGVDPDITYRVCNSRNTPCVTTMDSSYNFEAECSPVLYHVSACYSNSIETGCSEDATVMYPLGK